MISPTDHFLQVLGQMGNTPIVPAGVFPAAESRSLIRAGFLVSASSFTKDSSSTVSLSLTSGGGSASRDGDDEGDAEDQRRDPGNVSGVRARSQANTLFLSLPNTGPYLRLLGAGRGHLLSLLDKSSFREAPLYLLRDRWDGAVESDRSFDVAKRVRGEHAGILPGRTKKWKDLQGMSFRWALEEAVGAGLVEIFDTGSVGPGVRGL